MPRPMPREEPVIKTTGFMWGEVSKQTTGALARGTPGHPARIVRRHRHLYYVKDRGTTLLTRPGRVTEGLVLNPDRQITVADGRHIRLTEGYMVERDGDLLEAPPYLR